MIKERKDLSSLKKKTFGDRTKSRDETSIENDGNKHHRDRKANTFIIFCILSIPIGKRQNAFSLIKHVEVLSC